MTHILSFFDSIPFLLGVVVLLFFFTIQTPILTFPTYFFSFYSGVIYGLWLGSLLNYIGLTLSVNAGYYLGSAGKGERLRNSSVMKRFDGWLEKNGFKAIIFLRFAPIIPYNIVSIASGIVGIDRYRYFVINSLTVIPLSIIFAVLGNTFGASLLERLHTIVDAKLLIPTLIIIIIVIVAYLVLTRKEQEDIPKD